MRGVGRRSMLERSRVKRSEPGSAMNAHAFFEARDHSKYGAHAASRHKNFDHGSYDGVSRRFSRRRVRGDRRANGRRRDDLARSGDNGRERSSHRRRRMDARIVSETLRKGVRHPSRVAYRTKANEIAVFPHHVKGVVILAAR